MKKHSRNFPLIIIATAFAVVISVMSFVYHPFMENPLARSIGIFFISMLSSFLMILFIKILVFKKIFNLLNTVQKFKEQSDVSSPKLAYSSNEIHNLSIEILAWIEERKSEIDRLKKLEVYRKEYLGNISHELKTPVFNIQGYVLTLLDGGLEDPSINRNYLMRAEKSVDRMIAMIDDLEAISQLETGELQIEPESFDIIVLWKELLEAQEMQAKEKGIALTINEGNKALFVFADRFRIRQVIVNLIVNSIKYGKQGGETKIRFYDAGANISIEVADNGIGIAKVHLPRLFERFYRVNKSRSREQGGTGLGLAIVKHIIEAHNQKIKVMSTEGVGTVFSFNLKKG